MTQALSESMRVSGDGAIVLPETFRMQLGIRAGDPLEATIEAGRIVLSQNSDMFASFRKRSLTHSPSAKPNWSYSD
jgi:bifunctional DNA-binding transcriptional regulator/antitoxin component of YhaV-PrlF toxin-antitoxin module